MVSIPQAVGTIAIKSINAVRSLVKGVSIPQAVGTIAICGIFRDIDVKAGAFQYRKR